MILPARLRTGLLLIAVCFSFFTDAVLANGTNMVPPEPIREFRGAWVASVANIDWPSKKNLTTEQQKEELLAIFDKAVQLRLNAILLQVRPACDALYASKFEPWSEYLTGEIGKPPEPFYDPLTFAVEEAHKRGLELHAWFNPYRARILSSRSPVPANHVSKTHPDWAKKYVKYLWLDPGDPGVQQHNINVIMDVVKRYDVDGVHFDDYFYPYQDRDESGKLLDFPDEQSWQRYKELGGKLERNDWRRDNVNTFIERLSKAIKAERTSVKFGISPFGIWKPGVPQGIVGYNPYESMYADSRKWFTEGWLDYFAPQLYWNIDAPAQSYPVLLKWWASQNTQNRHLWPGLSVARVGNTRGPEEIVNQVLLTREQPGATGNIHWSMKSLMQNRRGVADMLLREAYKEPALIPAYTWLNTNAPAKPYVSGRRTKSSIKLHWQASGGEKAWLWLVQQHVGGKWYNEIFSLEKRTRILKIDDPGFVPDAIAVRAVSRYGILSPPSIYEFKPTPTDKK